MQDPTIPKLTRAEHFERLNAYSKDPAYAARTFDFDALVGQRWEIDEETYWYFLEVLPPLAWAGGSFYMSEALTDTAKGTITSRYEKRGARYFHEYAYLSAAGRREACA